MHHIMTCRPQTESEDKIFFCGAYWFNGFHEDGVNSALRVCKYFNKGLNSG